MTNEGNIRNSDLELFTFPTDEEIAQAKAHIAEMFGEDLLEHKPTPAPEPTRAEKLKYRAQVAAVYAAVGAAAAAAAIGLGYLLWDTQPESNYHHGTPATLPHRPQ